MGWTPDEVQAAGGKNPGTHPEHSNERAASMLQAWLYFGLIHAITELPFDTKDYLKVENDGHTSVCTTPLRRHFDRWKENVASKSKEDAETYIYSADKLMEAIYHILPEDNQIKAIISIS
jgi:hypothetical protein